MLIFFLLRNEGHACRSINIQPAMDKDGRCLQRILALIAEFCATCARSCSEVAACRSVGPWSEKTK